MRTDAPPARPSSRWDVPAAVALSLVVQTTISLLAACTPILAPTIAADRGWTTGLITFYAPLVCVASFVVSFQIPKLLRRLGGMGLSLACVAVSAAGLLCLLAPSVWPAVAVPLAIGLANGAMNPASSQILGPRTSPRTAGLIMSIKQTGVPLGGVLAGAALPLFVLALGWQATILGLILTSAALTIVLLPTVGWLNGGRSTAGPAKYRPLEPVSRLLAVPGMLNLLIAAMIFTGMQLCLRSFFTVYLVDEIGFGLGTAGLAFSVSQAAGIMGQIGWAVMSDRLLTSHAVMAVAGAAMTGAAVLTAAVTPGWPVAGIVAVAALYGVSAAGFVPVVLSEVARRSPPGQVGALTSGANLFLISGVMLGPLTFGGVASAAGHYAPAFVALAACTLAGSAIVIAPRHVRHRAPVSAEAGVAAAAPVAVAVAVAAAPAGEQ